MNKGIFYFKSQYLGVLQKYMGLTIDVEIFRGGLNTIDQS